MIADPQRTPEGLAQARAIVRRHGWNVTSYQILNPGFQFWLDAEREAVVGYIERNGVRVAGGAPVCADADLPAVVRAFERDTAAVGCGAVYFSAEHRLAQLAQGDARRITFPIGAQPLWQPASLVAEFAAHASLRAQLSRAQRKGVSVRDVTGAVDERTHDELRRCLNDWISRRGLPPLHFLIETNTLENLADRRVLVAERDGHAAGFLVATPIPARNGWLVEQLVRGGAAPNGTAELLLHEAALMFMREGARMITLGLAPLARRGHPAVNRAAPWLPALLAMLRANGRRFFNFEGLEQFKAKFGGAEWDPVYMSLAPGTRLPRALLAVTTAFSGESLYRFVPRLLLRPLLSRR